MTTFEQLVHLVARRPRPIIAGLAILGCLCAWLGLPAIGELHVAGNDFLPGDSQSARASASIERATGAAAIPTIVALVHSDQSTLSPAGGQPAAAASRIFSEQPDIAETTSYQQLPEYLRSEPLSEELFVSRDTDWTLVAGTARAGVLGTARASDLIGRLRRQTRRTPGVALGGSTVAAEELSTLVRHDIRHIELWVAPILALLLAYVFRRALAALLPLLVGALTTVEILALLRLLDTWGLHVSLFALTTVTSLGLGLAIDYTLLVLYRFREEVARHGAGATASTRAVTAAGRTILFSATTIVIAMAALMLFPERFLFSVGLGASLAAALAAINAIVLLTLAATLGAQRVLPSARDSSRERARAEGRAGGWWYRIPAFVVRRPARVALCAVSLLLLLSVPATGIAFRGIDSSILPESAVARRVFDTVRQRFAPPASDETLPLLVHAPRASEAQVVEYARGLLRTTGVLSVIKVSSIGPRLWDILVLSDGPPLSRASELLVHTVRAQHAPFPVEVAGPSASYIDQVASLRAHLPLALAIVALGTFLALFAMTGSVVLPLKTLVLNALSFFATFGVLVFVFQDGHLAWVFGAHGQEALESMLPILMFGAVFGLSTDYNVFVLARIQEERATGLDERAAIASGLSRSGPVVTTAALIFCIAVGAFAASEINLVKEISVGIALAVAIDATLVRALLLPAAMALLGRYNWWAPKWLRPLRPSGRRGSPASQQTLPAAHVEDLIA